MTDEDEFDKRCLKKKGIWCKEWNICSKLNATMHTCLKF